jgi:hypothetical protein
MLTYILRNKTEKLITQKNIAKSEFIILGRIYLEIIYYKILKWKKEQENLNILLMI